MNLPYNQVEELLSDEGFLAWYFKTDAGHAAAWDKRMAEDPAYRKLVHEAVQLLDSVRITEKKIDDQQYARAEQRLRKTISEENNGNLAKVVSMKRKRTTWWWAAAAIIVFAASWIGWQYFGSENTAGFTTAYGEIRDETFPDGSRVTLNANTEIRYGKNWQSGKEREVWIQGEAFFEVQKTTENSRFIVHTGKFDVIVTGTRFNVTSRSNKNNVLLKEGSVIIRPADGKEIVMKPGEFAEYHNAQLQKKVINDTAVIAWIERRFVFEKTPMKEVAASITEVYGINVILADDAVASIPVSGIFPNDNMEIFLKSLEVSQDFEIEKSGHDILVRKK